MGVYRNTPPIYRWGVAAMKTHQRLSASGLIPSVYKGLA